MLEPLLRVFLDANILAKPVTRTLLMVGGPLSGFRALWSRAAEQEATRHMGPRAISPAQVRQRFGGRSAQRVKCVTGLTKPHLKIARY